MKSEITDINPLVKVCNNYNCNLYYLCKGGCPYKEYVRNGTLNRYCNPKLIEQVNKILFIFELHSYGLLRNDITSESDLMREQKYVQTHEIYI